MPIATINSPRAQGAFELDGWLVEPDRNTVTIGDRSIRLEPKVMEVLVCLASQAGQVVTRRTIVDTVWATEFISDSTLTHAIATLRKVFDDDARVPRFIETIPKRGYRLVAAIDFLEAPAAVTSKAPLCSGPLAVVSSNRVHLCREPEPGPFGHLLLVRGHELNLADSEVVFGRSPEVAIQILSPEVSRRHARLELSGAGAVLSDLGSKNGTEVNERFIDGPVGLTAGDVIAVGPASFIYRSLSSEPTRTRDCD